MLTIREVIQFTGLQPTEDIRVRLADGLELILELRRDGCTFTVWCFVEGSGGIPDSFQSETQYYLHADEVDEILAHHGGIVDLLDMTLVEDGWTLGEAW